MPMILGLLGRFWYVLVIAVFMASTWYYKNAYQSEKREFEVFKIQVKAVGDAQEVKTKAQEEVDKLAKEKSDAQNVRAKRDLAALYDAYGKLRDQSNTSRRFVPEARAGATSPATVNFDRAGIDRALSDFDQGVTGLLRLGDEAITDLNTAKEWAQKQ